MLIEHTKRPSSHLPSLKNQASLKIISAEYQDWLEDTPTKVLESILKKKCCKYVYILLNFNLEYLYHIGHQKLSKYFTTGSAVRKKNVFLRERKKEQIFYYQEPFNFSLQPIPAIQ